MVSAGGTVQVGVKTAPWESVERQNGPQKHTELFRAIVGSWNMEEKGFSQGNKISDTTTRSQPQLYAQAH
jgi:hypothetical protein